MTAEAINFTPTPAPPPEAPRQDVRYVTAPTLESQLAVLGLTLGPEPTPTPAPVETPATVDPFADSDQAIAEALEDVEFGDSLVLDNPRFVGVARVRVVDVPLSERFDQYMELGILATGDEVVGLIRNVNDCVFEGWKEDGTLQEPEAVRDGVSLALVDRRVDGISAVVTLPSLPVTINGERYDLPLLSANSVTLDGVEEECPSLAGGALDFLGDAVSPDSLRGLGRGVGEALGALLGGAAEGLDRGFND